MKDDRLSRESTKLKAHIEDCSLIGLFVPVIGVCSGADGGVT